PLKSKSHALIESTSKEKKAEKKKERKDQPKKETKTKTKFNTKASNSKPRAQKDKFLCSYSKKSSHKEHLFIRKQIDHLSHLLEKNQIGVPKSIKQKALKAESSTAKGSKSDKKKGKPLIYKVTPSSKWIIDSSSSHHMVSSHVEFSNIEPCGMCQITMGNDMTVSVSSSGSVEMDGGAFNQVLSVPDLSTNLLSVYQITHL
ncbi:hypothetical protein KI387_002753, partial [Taxus chinensis]